MNDLKYLTTTQLNEIIKYKTSSDYDSTCIPISGNPRKHPYDKNRMILILESHDDKTFFHDLKLSDIAHIEELPNISKSEGGSLKQIKVWVKKGCWIIKSEAYKCGA
jgi:inorganic pyrophosphatase